MDTELMHQLRDDLAAALAEANSVEGLSKETFVALSDWLYEASTVSEFDFTDDEKAGLTRTIVTDMTNAVEAFILDGPAPGDDLFDAVIGALTPLWYELCGVQREFHVALVAENERLAERLRGRPVGYDEAAMQRLLAAVMDAIDEDLHDDGTLY